MSDPSGSVHLLVLIHGMWGNPDHLAEMKRIYSEKLSQNDSQCGPNGETVHALVVETNRDSSTYDGIDWGGERVADEIRVEIKRLEAEGKTVTRFSITGYSLGGLIARYVVGILHQDCFFDKVTPVNFTTVATPHIGLIRYPSFRSSLFAYLGPRLLSRTGEQFYGVDKWSVHGRPLLEVMADPARVFLRGLSLFPHVTFYANAVNDMTVPYMTAAAEPDDPFAANVDDLEIEFDEDYKPIMKSWTLSTSTKEEAPKPRLFSKMWFKSFKRVPVPPALDFRFPYNLLIYTLLPILLPMFLTIVVVRLSLDSHSSRSRIKLLENHESARSRLVHIIGQIERSMEDVVVDYIDDGGDMDPRLASPSSTLADLGPGGPPESHPAITHDRVSGAPLQQLPSGPVVPDGSLLTDKQRKMIKNIGSITQLRKERAFIHPVMNSHATIIARDVKRFKFHAIGHGVLRHMADHFTV